MLLTKVKLQHINTIAHEGKVVVFGTDAEGKVWYTVKQDGFEDSYLNTPADKRTGFEEWKELALPDENDDRSVINKETAEFTYKDNPDKFIIRSRYKTKNESAVAPVQLVSGLGHIYVFRQSKSNTLLVDRFVLDGMTNELTRKLEVRFKRSRQKYKASEKMKMGVGGLQNIDSLDYRDTDNNFFYEPTTELCLIDNLYNGWFSVIQVPTNEHEKYRWHIFSCNSQIQKIELTTILASAQGLFDVKDYTVLEPKSEQDETLIPRSIPGIIKRTLDISGVTITNGLAATKYDLQQEKETSTKDSEGKPIKQLLRNSTKVMLAVPTDKGTAALSLAIAGDGTLSQIDETPENTIIRSYERDVLLPLNTLEAIKVIADTTPPALGTVTGFAAGTEADDVEDLVVVTSQEADSLEDGDMVKLKNTIDVNGLYQATTVDEDTFTIDLTSPNGMGIWEKVEEEAGGLVFDGAIVSYQKTIDGKLLVSAVNHGLDTGDQVQVVGTQAYNDTFPIKKLDNTRFVIERRWIQGEAVNVKLESMKRRGVVFDGQGDYISLPEMEFNYAQGFSIEAWVRYESFNSWSRIIDFGNGENKNNIVFANSSGSNALTLSVRCGSENMQLQADGVLEIGQWMHLAATVDATGKATIYKNGQILKTTTLQLPESIKRTTNYIGKSNWATDSYFKGQIANLRLWKKARTGKEIKDEMYLQLTGREVDLVGYWRLGAISEDLERKVVDFSVNGNDGVVYGDAYVGGITLSRHLRDNTTPAVKYTNFELFAVSQRSTYIEEFEFKVDGSVDVNNADGTGNKIFQITYWGKTSRSAEEKIPITAIADDFQSLGNGWYRAACRFTVPDSISMVRSFEISNVKGTWNTLEIRKHRIRLVSDAITEAKYSDSISLTALADNYSQLQIVLKNLDRQESEEAVLLQEKRDIEDKLAALKSGELLALQIKVDQLKAIKDALYAEYQKQLNHPLNYVCTIKLLNTQTYVHIEIASGSMFAHPTAHEWQFIEEGNGKYEIKLADNFLPNYPKRFIHAPDPNISSSVVSWQTGHQWQAINCGNDQYRFKLADHEYVGSPYRDFHAEGGTNRLVRSLAGTAHTWQLTKLRVANQTKIDNAKTASDQAHQDHQNADKKLRELKGAANDPNIVLLWESRLQKLNTELLPDVQNRLNQGNNQLLNAVRSSQQTPQSMAVVHKVVGGYQKGLIAQGALLGFVRPASRLKAMETCEGNVQLSYFDDQGRMRQTNYDATADSLNPTFEQWIPDGLRTCLNLNNSKSVIKLAQTLYLGENSTLETWFAYPFSDRLSWRILTTSEDDSQQIVIYNDKQLGLRTNGYFHDSGYNLEQLSRGWHHLAIRSKNKASDFYIDGKKVGETTAKSTLAFDGENDHVSLPPMKIDFSKGFTVEAWVLYNDLSTWSRIIDLNTGSGLNSICLDNFLDNVNATNKLRLSVTNGSTKQTESTEVLETGKWMHLAASIDGDGNIFLYKNGQVIATNKGILPSNTTVEWTLNFIGKSKWQHDSIYNGQITEVRLWNISRTQTEIQANFGKTLKGNELSLVAYWQFTGGGAEDSSPKKYHGTIQGKPNSVKLAAAFDSNIRAIGNFCNQPIVDTAVSTLPTAMQFDGLDDYVEIPAHPNLTDAMTISLWAKSNTATWNENGFLISKRDAFVLHPAQGSKLIHIYFVINGGWQAASFTPNIDITQWHHYAGTFDGNTIRLCIDGIEVAKTNCPGKIAIDTGAMYIGRDDGFARYFHGQIAEVQIWNKAFTPAEIQAQMGKILKGNEVGLTGYWRLGHNSAKDYSPNGRNGNIYSNPQTVPFPVQVALINQTSGGLNLDGLDDYLELPVSSIPGGNEITVAFWSRGSSSLPKETALIEAVSDNNYRVLGIHLPWSNSVVYFDCGTNPQLASANFDRLEKAAQAAEYRGEWVHWAFTKNAASGEMKIYRNGALWHSGTGKMNPLTPCKAVKIGRLAMGSSAYYAGAIAELSIWHRALTPTEIQAIMGKILAGNETGLTGYWRFADGTAKDYTVHGRNGTIFSNPTPVSFDKVQTQLVQITTDSTASTGSALLPKSNQFGKLAEIRIWNLALSDEEIAVNSKTLLSGNEPGLAAYYPMNEATGHEIRDYSGNNRHGVMDGASWWGCAAPIGHLGQPVMQFDGKNDFITLPASNVDYSQGFSLEVWVYYNSFKNWARIIDFGLGFSEDNIIFTNRETSGDLILNIQQGSAEKQIQASGVLEIGQWIHLAVTVDAVGNAKLYKNGQVIQSGQIYCPRSLNRTQNLIGKSNRPGYGCFDGKMTELRIWKTARTAAEVRASLHKRLTGKETNLAIYLPLSEIKAEATTVKTTDLVSNALATVSTAAIVSDNTIPIAGDAIVSCEYSTVTIHPTTKQKAAMMRRFFASPGLNGVEVLPDKRIETVVLQWIGNAQFAPTLLGYIEGPPPIPTENLTVQPDYNGATSVELAMSEDVEFSWNRSQDSGLGTSVDLFAGVDSESSVGVGVETKASDIRAGFKGNLSFGYQFMNETNITSSSSLSMTDKLELRGTPEQSAKFPHLGLRFIPKNVGYALVISSLADVFITKLARSGRMVGYQVQPVEGIPPDVNTITFLINPAYTMSGSLDGMTGSSATSDRFFKHVPEMRSQYGSLYPASYYRLREAYDLKQAIEQEDKRRESYFAQFNARFIDETLLNLQVGSSDAPSAVSVQREEDKSATDMTEAEKKDADQAKQDQLQKETAAASDKQSAAVQQKQGEIDNKIADQEKHAHATSSFAGWQKKMENILVRAGKRNIVNTYVWDGDGGMRTEAQSFASTAQHTVGGSFSLDAGLGFEGNFGVLGKKVELTALATVNMTQTMSKTESRSKGIQLHVDLSGVENVGITDYNDYPIQPGEKVDRYRFMSFYLEGSTNNFYDFFSYVVDPEWLRSNDEEARALRQVQGKANKTWRVLHRVTYVERPALMGFGRDLRRVGDSDRATQEILDYFTQLEVRHQELKTENQELKSKIANVQKELVDSNQELQTKLDRILTWISQQQAP